MKTKIAGTLNKVHPVQTTEKGTKFQIIEIDVPVIDQFGDETDEVKTFPHLIRERDFAKINFRGTGRELNENNEFICDSLIITGCKVIASGYIDSRPFQSEKNGNTYFNLSLICTKIESLE